MASYKKKSEKRRKKNNEVEEETEEIFEHSVDKTFKKRSVFFQLEYWETLLIRNNLDIMHVEKNVFDNIVHTILDTDKRSKDNLNSRLDLAALNIRAHLHANITGPKAIIPRAIYQMDKIGQKNFLMVLKYAKFPDGYASNLFNKVNLTDKRMVGLKTHAYQHYNARFISSSSLQILAFICSCTTNKDKPVLQGTEWQGHRC